MTAQLSTPQFLQCAGCNNYVPWEALLIGCISGMAYVIGSRAVKAMWLDDPMDVIAVHFGGGTVVTHRLGRCFVDTDTHFSH